MSIPKKERLAVQEIRDALKTRRIIILSGLRNLGKTVALQQLAASEEGIYLDCRTPADVNRIDDYLISKKGLLLLDEFHHHPNCFEISKKIADVVSGFDSRLKVVITSSSVHFCNVLYTLTLGGSRAKLVRMPFLTFTEYRYLVKGSGDYLVFMDATEKEWLEYTEYRGPLGLPSIDRHYLLDLLGELTLAYRHYDVYEGNLGLTIEDVENAFILLTYNLNSQTTLKKRMNPVISGKEMREDDRIAFQVSPEYQQFSVTKASLGAKEMTIQQIGKSLYFLLWSNLIVATGINKEFTFSDLPAVHNLTQETLDALFRDFHFTVMNPLLYSVISDELCYLSKRPVITPSNPSERWLLGLWTKVYFRGACSLISSGTLLGGMMLQKPRDKGGYYEVDILEPMSKTMLEITVRDKPMEDVCFSQFPTYQKAILTTPAVTEILHLERLEIYKMPFYHLVGYLDARKLKDIFTSNSV